MQPADAPASTAWIFSLIHIIFPLVVRCVRSYSYYHRRCAATRLDNWGTAEADNGGVCGGIAASGMGARVYEVCGFTKLKTAVVHVQGQDESLNCYVMHIPASYFDASEKRSM